MESGTEAQAKAQEKRNEGLEEGKVGQIPTRAKCKSNNLSEQHKDPAEPAVTWSI